MRTYVIPIPAAVAGQAGAAKLDIAASFVKVISYDGTVGSLVVRAESVANGEVDSDFVVMNIGDKARFPAPVDSFTFFNSDAFVRNLVVVIGKGDYDQNLVTGNVVVVAGNVIVRNIGGPFLGFSDDAVINNATSVDIAADPNRSTIIVQAHPNNTGEICVIGFLSVANGGIHLQAGERAVIDSSGGVRIRNNSGVAQTWSFGTVGN